MITPDLIASIKGDIASENASISVDIGRIINDLYNHRDYQSLVGSVPLSDIESALKGDVGKRIAADLTKRIASTVLDKVYVGAKMGADKSAEMMREAGASESQLRIFQELENFGVHDLIARIQLNRRFPFRPSHVGGTVSVETQGVNFTDPAEQPDKHGYPEYKSYAASPTLRERAQRIARISVDSLAERIRVAEFWNSRGEGIPSPKLSSMDRKTLSAEIDYTKSELNSLIINNQDVVPVVLKDSASFGKLRTIVYPKGHPFGSPSTKVKVYDLSVLPNSWAYANPGGTPSPVRFANIHAFIQNFVEHSAKLEKLKKQLGTRTSYEDAWIPGTLAPVNAAQESASPMFAKWVSRFIESEYLRAVQWSSLRTYRAFSVKFVKWQLSPDHQFRLNKNNLRRDWCDDLAQCPPENSLSSKDAQYIRNLANLDPDALYGGNTDTEYWTGGSWASAYTPPYLGIYYAKDFYKVKIPAYRWYIKGRIQHVYGRQLRDMFIPPHPYCSCLILPVYINPAEDDRWRDADGKRLVSGSKSIIEIAVDNIGVDGVRNMLRAMEEEAAGGELTFAEILMLITPALSVSLDSNEIVEVARTISSGGVEELYTPIDEVIRIAA